MSNACAGQKYREMRNIIYINFIPIKTIAFYCFHHLSVTFQYRNY
jgi:hypothetical protein